MLHQKLAHCDGTFLQVSLKREVTRRQKFDRSGWEVSLERFCSGRDEVRIELAPYREEWRLRSFESTPETWGTASHCWHSPGKDRVETPRSPLPQRDRATHAQAIRSTLDAALTMAQAWRREREPDLAQGTPGFSLDFEIHPGSEMAAALLENRRKNIELVAVRQESETANIVATVFVPDAAADHFLKKVEAYPAENTRPFARIVLV